MYFFVLKKKYGIALLLLCAFALVLFFVFDAFNIETIAVGESGVAVPILMYHSVLKDPAAAGEYVVSPQTFEEDLLYLKNQGYTSILSKDLVDFAENGKSLPDKPVMITLDDGHANNLLYVLPVLEKLDMRAVICIVGEYSEAYSNSEDHNPSYAYLSWQQIRALVDSGRVEIANHSYAMHKQEKRQGTKIMRGETSEEYAAAIANDLNKTQQLLMENCAIEPIAFAYPFGLVCADSVTVLQALGFKVNFGCEEHVNYITDSDSLYCLGRFNRASGISTERFMQRLKK